MFNFVQINQNQIFHYTRCNTPKRATSSRGPSPSHCARATQLLSKKCLNGGEPLATLCPIWPARRLNLRLPAPETNALPLDQLALIACTSFLRDIDCGFGTTKIRQLFVAPKLCIYCIAYRYYQYWINQWFFLTSVLELQIGSDYFTENILTYTIGQLTVNLI